MSQARPFLGGLFPAPSVLDPLWKDTAPHEPEIPSSWGSGGFDAAQITRHSDRILRALTLAGWQTTYLSFCIGMGFNDWLDIDLGERTSWAGSAGPGGDYADTDLVLVFLARAMKAPDGNCHAIPLGEPSGSDWAAETSGDDLTLTLAASYDVQPAVSEALDWLDAAMDAVENHLLGLVQERYGGTVQSGLSWLFDRSNWFAYGMPADPNQSFVWVLYSAAGELMERVMPEVPGQSVPLNSDELLTGQQLESTPLPELIGALGLSYAKLARDALRQNLAEEGVGPHDLRFRLADALSDSAWFDVLCMLVHCGVISPSLLEAPDVSDFFAAEPPMTDPISADIYNTGGIEMGEQKLVINLYGTPMVTLSQADHWIDAQSAFGVRLETPDIRDNVAWEYLGILKNGYHGLALTVGRGVTITEHDCGIAYEVSVYLTQLPKNIPKALLTPLSQTASDDIEALNAQPLGHMAQNRPAVWDSEFPPDIEVWNILASSPPFLVVTPLGDGATKFEWFPQGGSGPLPGDGSGATGTLRPGAPGQDYQQQQLPPPRAFELIIRPKNTAGPDLAQPRPEAHVRQGDFALCYDIDYVVMDVTPAERARAQSWFDYFHNEVVAQMMPVPRIETPLSRGQAVLRLWYAGEVEFEIYRHPVLARHLDVEIARLDDPLDVPEQGEILPCKLLAPEELDKDDHPWHGYMTGRFDLRMSEPDLPMIPSLTSSNLTLLKGFKHVSILEIYWETVDFADFGHTPVWDTTGIYIVPESELAGWQASGRDGEAIAGSITVDYPTFPAWTLFTIGVDIGVGFIPIVGDLVDIAEFVYAASTGYDKWGNPVAGWELALMGLGACVPFVSNGMVKGGKIAVSGAVMGAGAAVYMSGSAGGLDLLKAFWVALGSGAEHADQIEALGDAMNDASRPFARISDRREQLARLADWLSPEDLARLAASVGDGVADMISGGLVNGAHLVYLARNKDGAEEMRFIFDGMEAAYGKWLKRRVGLPEDQLTRMAFLNARASSSGRWRMILETLGGADLIGKGRSQARALWPGLTHLVFDGLIKLPPADIAVKLANRTQLDSVLNNIPARHWPMVEKHQDTIRNYLASMDEASVLELLGSRARSPEEVAVVMAHLMEHADDALRAADTSFDRLEDLRPALDELLKSGITGTGYQHGAMFEFFGNAFRLTHAANEGRPTVRFQTLLWAGEGVRRLGPDATEFAEDGYSFTQFKSLSDAAKQVGEVSYQDNMTQMFKDFYRLSKSPDPWKLDPDQVPEGALNVFSGRYASVINLDQIRSAGQLGVDEFWRLWGGEMLIDLAEDFSHYDDEFQDVADAFIRALDNVDELDGGVLRITKLEDFQALMARLDDDALTFLETWLTGRQAFDMQNLLDNLDTVEALQNHLTNNPRAASLLMQMLKKQSDDFADLSRETLQQPGGAQAVFNALELEDGWMNVGRALYHQAQVDRLGLRKLNQMSPPGTLWKNLSEADQLTILNREFPFPSVQVVGLGRNKMERWW